MGLQIDPRTGGSISRSGIGENYTIPLRQVLDGVVANAEVVAVGNDPAFNGIIDIKEVLAVALYVNFTLGSLTSMDIIPEFSMNDPNPSTLLPLGWFRLGTGAIASGVISVTNAIYRYIASLNNVIVIPNPGANYMRIITSSVGTVTSSAARLNAIRGWPHPKLLGIP